MASQTAIRRYVRFAIADRTAYGLWKDGTIEELKGSIYEEASPSGASFRAGNAGSDLARQGSVSAARPRALDVTGPNTVHLGEVDAAHIVDGGGRAQLSARRVDHLKFQ